VIVVFSSAILDVYITFRLEFLGHSCLGSVVIGVSRVLRL
jgi:hypothetical protein